jgi:hypothetical protein
MEKSSFPSLFFPCHGGLRSLTVVLMSKQLKMLAEMPISEESMSFNRIERRAPSEEPSVADDRLAKVVEIIVNEFQGNTSAYFAYLQANRPHAEVKETEEVERMATIASRFSKSS